MKSNILIYKKILMNSNKKQNNKELRIKKNKIIKNLLKLMPKNKSLLNNKIYFFNYK
jgi:hypothetical protein